MNTTNNQPTSDITVQPVEAPHQKFMREQTELIQSIANNEELMPFEQAEQIFDAAVKILEEGGMSHNLMYLAAEYMKKKGVRVVYYEIDEEEITANVNHSYDENEISTMDRLIEEAQKIGMSREELFEYLGESMQDVLDTCWQDMTEELWDYITRCMTLDKIDWCYVESGERTEGEDDEEEAE